LPVTQLTPWTEVVAKLVAAHLVSRFLVFKQHKLSVPCSQRHGTGLSFCRVVWETKKKILIIYCSTTILKQELAVVLLCLCNFIMLVSVVGFM
jgi:hypothetical protein